VTVPPFRTMENWPPVRLESSFIAFSAFGYIIGTVFA
jgi:hypothetical protein